MTAAFVYNEALTEHILRQNHPLQPRRLRYVYDLLDSYGVLNHPNSTTIEPRHARPEEISTFHTKDYVQAIQEFSRGDFTRDPRQYNLDSGGDTPTFPGIFEASSLSTGATLVAMETVMNNTFTRVFTGSGGLHHAFSNRASGFCVFNDPVIAIMALRNQGLKVAYIDIDAHHGDGVQDAFYDTDQILTISIHESGDFLFPGTGSVEETGQGRGRGYSVNIPLAPSTGDDVYLEVFRAVVPRIVQAFHPDILFTQLGVDGHYMDPLTHLRLTTRGYRQLYSELQNLSPGYWIATGGGGYDLSAVARCWSLAYATMADVNEELDRKIPDIFQNRYGLTNLDDPTDEPENQVATLEQTRAFAQESARRVKDLVFPSHNLLWTP